MTLAEYKKLFFTADNKSDTKSDTINNKTSEILHFNNAGLSPITKPVLEEINYWTERFYTEGFHSDADYKSRMEWARQEIAKLIDGQADEIAFFQSCAWAVSQFAFGINLLPGEEVILFDQEYASNLYPWQSACEKANAKLLILKSGPNCEITFENIENKISAKTRVIAISSVQYQTGVMIDLTSLSQLCQRHNILLFVDVTQGLGIHESSMKDLNIAGLACSSHKWLNAPVGVGFLAVKKELAIKMNPIAIGAMTYGECDDPSNLQCLPKHNAFKFEAGAKQVLEICALGKAAEIINQIGMPTLRDEAFRLTGLLSTEIKKMDFILHSSFVTSQFINISPKNGDNKKLQNYLFENGVRVPIRGPGVRLTPHAFNTDDQVSKLVEILKRFF